MARPRFALAIPLLSCFAIVTRLAAAQCSAGFSCDSLSIPYDSGELYGGVDPHDGSYQGQYVQVCPCANNEVLTVAITYTDTDNTVHSATASQLLPSSSTYAAVTLSFPTVTNTDISSNSPVTVLYALDSPEEGESFTYGSTSFVYTPVTSNFFTEATTTVTSTVISTTGSTSTVTVTSTTSISQQTSTTPCTTGTATVTASPSTTTYTSTITPKPVKETHPRVIIITTHASCYSCSSNQKREEEDRRLVNRQTTLSQGVVETPYFTQIQGPPQSTTYTTGTSVSTSTATTTVTDTAIATATQTSTDSPTPLTTTVCSDVDATVTTTPTYTSTVVTTASRKTKIVTRTCYITETIYPSHATVCSIHYSTAETATPLKHGSILHPPEEL